jgi:acetylglutamate kinase
VGIVNLTTDYEALTASRELSRKQHEMLRQARRLVSDGVPQRMTLSITSPFELLRELFTVRGAGTLLRRGAVIRRRGGLDEVDRGRLAGLLSSSFGRAPTDDFLSRPVSRIYLEEGYRGAALLIDTPLGGYLTKFAVDREAQGEGMGRDLWELVVLDYPTVFWRARPENPVNAWYTRQADGLHRLFDWHVFWKGLLAERIPQAIEFALAQPVDLMEPASATP